MKREAVDFLLQQPIIPLPFPINLDTDLFVYVLSCVVVQRFSVSRVVKGYSTQSVKLAGVTKK